MMIWGSSVGDIVVSLVMLLVNVASVGWTVARGMKGRPLQGVGDGFAAFTIVGLTLITVGAEDSGSYLCFFLNAGIVALLVADVWLLRYYANKVKAK